MVKFKINKEKAIEVTKKSVFMLKKKSYPFDNEHVLPDTILPDNIQEGSLEHILFLFYTCSIDSGKSSKKVYETMREITKLIRLDRLYCYNKEHLIYHIGKYLRNPDAQGSPIETLMHNSMKLHMEYGDDPINLKRKTIDETIKELKKFDQVGPGIAALIMKNFVRFGIWKFSKYQIPIKVDRHVIKISVGTGVVETDEEVIRSDQLIKPLSNTYKEITSQKIVSAIDLDDALWGIGSNLCFKNNKMYCHGLCNLECKIRPKSDGRVTWVYPQKESRKTEFLPFIKRYNH